MVHRKTKSVLGAKALVSGGATAKDIALATGVSATTVASILSGRDVVRVSAATRERVLASASELGYRRNRLATALRTGRTNTLGIVSPLVWSDVEYSIRSLYLTELLTVISVAAARAGMNAMTFIDSSLQDLSTDSVADGRVEGVILFGLPADLAGATEWVSELEATGIPVVEIGSCYSRHQIHADNAGGAKRAVEYLLEQGHRSIGCWQAPTRSISTTWRRDGFEAAVREAGLSAEQTPLVTTHQEFAALLHSAARPTAFFCSSDRMAVEAYKCLHEAGLRVPEDMSVIGFDNSVLAETMLPPLSSVQNPLGAMAAAAVSLLLSQIEGQEIAPFHDLIEAPLVVRESAAPPCICVQPCVD